MSSLQLKGILSVCLKATQGFLIIFFLLHVYVILSLLGFHRDLPGLVSRADDLDDKSSCSAITATPHVLFILIILFVVVFLLLHYFGHMLQSFSTSMEPVLVLLINKGKELIFHFARHL